jgi:hypothetical protein
MAEKAETAFSGKRKNIGRGKIMENLLTAYVESREYVDLGEIAR